MVHLVHSQETAPLNIKLIIRRYQVHTSLRECLRNANLVVRVVGLLSYEGVEETESWNEKTAQI